MNNIIRTAGHTQSPGENFHHLPQVSKCRTLTSESLTTSAVSDERGATEPNHLQALKTGFQNNSNYFKEKTNCGFAENIM